MKREIKFRIWNGNAMIYDITAGKFGTFYVNPENGNGLNPEDTASLSVNTTKYNDDIPVMQFVGVKDSNKVDIYEGDKCKDGDGKVYEIKYAYTGFVARSYSNGMSYCIDNDLEVIGNIYECNSACTAKTKTSQT